VFEDIGMRHYDLAAPISTHLKLEFSPDGRYLAVGSNPVRVIDTTEIGLKGLIEIPSIFDCTFARNRRELVYITTPDTESDVEAFDLDARTIRVGAQVGYVQCLAAHPDGARIFAGVIGPVRGEFWVKELRSETLQEACVFSRSEEVVNRLELSADGETLATEGYGLLETYPCGGGPAQVRQRIRSDPVPSSFALSSDGTRLAVALAAIPGLRVWDTQTGTELFRSGKHRRHVTAVAYSPDRPLLGSGDTGGQVFIWHGADVPVRRYDWGLSKVAGLRFAPDGFRCAAVDVTGKVVIWDVDV
jgi:WD40 repeat protein